MKFSDKLKKLRKDNNLSQERLADLLEVSRQAVSKWESGSSYPDMEKMKKMCKVLNCTLEDLLDDGCIGKSENNKINLVNSFNDFLKIVTNTYNMFCAMRFKEKIKCMLEMLLIAFILWIMSEVVFAIFNIFIFNLFLNIPKIGSFIDVFFENVLVIVLVIIDVIVFIHLFKIRYLEYYVTVEDQSVVTKTLEDPINEVKSSKERVIIRDPKHSSSTFLNVLATIVIAIIKFMAFFLIIPFGFLFILFTVVIFLLFCYLKYGVIFLTAIIGVLGLLGIAYIFIKLLYNFIFSRKQNFKRIFILFISSLILLGAGIGLTLGIYMTFDEVNDLTKEFQTNQIVHIEMTKDTVLNSNNIVYNIDDSVKDIRLESKYIKYSTSNPEGQVWYIHSYQDTDRLLKLLAYDVKNKNKRDYNKLFESKINVTVSKKNYDILKDNYSNYLSNNVVEE